MATLSVGGSASVQDSHGENFANIVREQAIQYLNSFPGNDASGCNSVHAWFQDLVEGKPTSKERLEILSNALCYRMSMTKLATDFKEYLDLPIADAHLFDTWAWERKLLEACNKAGLKEKWDYYQEIRSAILKAKVFNLPARIQGRSFSKPSEYLAIAFYESGRQKAQILDEIQKLAACKCCNIIIQ